MGDSIWSLSGSCLRPSQSALSWRLRAAIRAIWHDLQVARYLQRRCDHRKGSAIIRRNSDGTLWTAGSPQNLAYAMRGLFERRRCDSFHFYRVREWEGVLVASRKVFWNPQSGEFRVLYECPTFQLPRWPEDVECRKIDERMAA